jgi:hypothetical protein
MFCSHVFWNFLVRISAETPVSLTWVFRTFFHSTPFQILKKKVIPVLNELSTTPWRCMGEWMYKSTFSWLGINWRWVVSFTISPLYTRGKKPIEQEVGWTPEPVRTTWRRENSWPYWDSNSDPSVVQPVDSSYTDCATPVPNPLQLFNATQFGYGQHRKEAQVRRNDWRCRNIMPRV